MTLAPTKPVAVRIRGARASTMGNDALHSARLFKNSRVTFTCSLATIIHSASLASRPLLISSTKNQPREGSVNGGVGVVVEPFAKRSLTTMTSNWRSMPESLEPQSEAYAVLHSEPFGQVGECVVQRKQVGCVSQAQAEQPCRVGFVGAAVGSCQFLDVAY